MKATTTHMLVLILLMLPTLGGCLAPVQRSMNRSDRSQEEFDPSSQESSDAIVARPIPAVQLGEQRSYVNYNISYTGYMQSYLRELGRGASDALADRRARDRFENQRRRIDNDYYVDR